MPKRSCMARATVTGSREAPESASRTEANVAGSSSSKWANAAHSAGAPGMTVTPRSRSTAPPWPGRTAARAGAWRRRAARARARRSARRCGTAAARRRSRRRARCDPRPKGSVRCCAKIAVAEHRRPRRPGRAAGEHQGGDVVVVDVDDVDRRRLPGGRRMRRARRCRRSVGHDGLDRRHSRPVDVRPVGCTHLSMTTTLAPTTASSLSISGAGLDGLSGTATAPRPTVAK